MRGTLICSSEDMTSKVSLGGGGRPPPSSSSSSHLSASAPPFTVDRSNSKPLQFSDFQYASNFAPTWNFANPVPAIQSDEYCGGSESDADSRWSSMNPSAKSSTHQYFYENIPYASPAVENGTPLVTVSDCKYEILPSTGLESAGFSSQLDYTQNLLGLDYSSQWYGLGDTKLGKLAENDGTFPFQKTTTHESLHYMKQGCSLCKCGNIFVNDSCASCGLLSDSIGRESRNGLLHMSHTDNTSLMSKDSFFPFDSARGTSLISEFTDKKSLPLGSSMQSPVKSITYRNPNDPYEKHIKLSGSGVGCSVSVTESSPSSLIRTPNVGLGLGLCKSISGKSIETNDVTYVPHNEVINNYNISKEKETRVMLDPGGQECSIPISQTKSHKVDQGDIFSVFPSIMEEPFSGPQDKDTTNSVVGVNFSSQVPQSDLLNGCLLPCDTAQAIRSQEKFSDCLEHHNTGIDSPCWKGAPSSQLSPFDFVEGEATPHIKQRPDNDLPVISFFGKTSDDQVGYGIVFEATEQTKSPALQSSKGVQCCEYSIKPVEEHYFPNSSGTERNMVAHDNIKEGGAIAVRAAEDVLCSNSSEDSEIAAQSKEKSPPRLDVQMLTNSMKNISEMLLSYCCSDPFALKEQNLEAIEDVISNLHGLLPKKTVHLTRPPVPILSQLENFHKSGDYFDPHVNIGPAVSQAVHNVSVREHVLANFLPNNEKKTTYDDFVEKDERFQQMFQIKDDLDMFGDDNMTKSIKKVLDENFNCGEEIQPLAVLFKDLWLEAEARLCRFSYKARFDRVKIEMESFRSNQLKERCASSLEKDSSTKNPHDSSSSDVLTNNAKKNGSVQEDANDLEASVMARLNILKRRNSTDDRGNPGSANGRRMHELSPGFIDKTSSDWEHVVKDDAWSGPALMQARRVPGLRPPV